MRSLGSSRISFLTTRNSSQRIGFTSAEGVASYGSCVIRSDFLLSGQAGGNTRGDYREYVGPT
jgi:hypothetical protein